MAYTEIKYKEGDCFKMPGLICKILEAFKYMRMDRYKVEIISVDKSGQNIDRYTAQMLPAHFAQMTKIKAKEYKDIADAIDSAAKKIEDAGSR